MHDVVSRVALEDLPQALTNGHGLTLRPSGHVDVGQRIGDVGVLDRELLLKHSG